MEASGSNVKYVPVIGCDLFGDDDPVYATVVSSGDTVDINGDYTFNRDDLLFAIGINSGDLDRINGRR